MKWTSALQSMVTAMRPWAPKRERRAAVQAATREKERSQASAAQSRKVRQQIDRLARVNGYAQTIQDDIIRGYRQG